MIGDLGCSNTQITVAAAREIGAPFWPTVKYGGGEVDRWAVSGDAGKYWKGFSYALAKYGADAIWWQLCAHSAFAATLDADADRTLDRLRSRVGNMPVYVSAINGYNPDNLNAGYVAVEACRATAARLVGAGLVLAGPTMPDLTAEQTDPRHVHPDGPGRKLCGQALADFPAFKAA